MTIASYQLARIEPHRSAPNDDLPASLLEVRMTATSEWPAAFDGIRVRLWVPKDGGSTVQELAELARHEAARRLRAIADDLDGRTLTELEALDAYAEDPE